MKPTNFSIHLSHFLTDYLAGSRNLSPNTIKAYRDVFILLLSYCHEVKSMAIEKLEIEQINVALIENFLDYLEKERHCSQRTLNHRLATLHAFFRYIQLEEPELLLQCQQILALPFRRCTHPEVGYLSKEHLVALLAQPDLNKPDGRRDAILLSTLYDTGARVQELIDLTVGDVRLELPAQVRILGKGRKIRTVPLMDNTVKLIRNYLYENNFTSPDKFDHPLFQNHQGNKLTRAGVSYILKKYAHMVSKRYPHFKQKISPHTLRHTKGMHLLQGGVSLEVIRDFLGHVDIKTTEVYARANLEMKRAAIEKVSTAPTPKIPSWKENKSLFKWLQSL